MTQKISIVIPSYNEQDNVKVLAKALVNIFQNLTYDYECIFVNDGSSDQTLANLKELAHDNPKIFYINLSRNFGHQNALKAGLIAATGDAVISMDADMQHPPQLVVDLLKKWEDGYDVVYTKRLNDKKLPFIKRLTSVYFYKLINSLSVVKIEEGAADFRLMDKNVLRVFNSLNENELFIRGLVSWVGFKQIGIEYYPAERLSGESKYTLKKMLRFGLQGITSFSTRPLYVAVFLGLFISVFAFIFYMSYVVYSLYFGHVISGWASVISTVVFFGGLNMIILGIIGIYIGKMFMQTKNRPNFIIQETNLPQ